MPTHLHDSQQTDTEPTAALLLRIGVVMRITGLGRSTIYRLLADEQFPRPVRVAKRAIAWRRADVERWSEARPTVAH